MHAYMHAYIYIYAHTHVQAAKVSKCYMLHSTEDCDKCTLCVGLRVCVRVVCVCVCGCGCVNVRMC